MIKQNFQLQIMEDHLRIACGVFGGVDFEYGHVFPQIYWGLRVQNHRGHHSHGFLTYDGRFNTYRGLGLVPKMERKTIQDWLNRLPGHVGIGNVRYTTSGEADEESLIKSAMPVKTEYGKSKIALSFNGNVVNVFQCKKELNKPLHSCGCDAELFCGKLLAELMKSGDLVSSVKTCMEEVEGGFSVVGLTQNGDLFAFKDPYGIRPLCYGHDKDHTFYAASSETVGLDVNELEYDSEVKPGEFLIATKDGFTHESLVTGERKALCAFEFAYFARPDSLLGEKYVYEIREEFGRNLGREYSEIVRGVDVIVSMPETGNDAAWGLHEETGIRWERALRRHRYVTERAFILSPHERQKTLQKKINILDKRIRGKNLIVVDDSIVRGETTKAMVKRLRKKGAKKIHLFITFPRIIGPCFYGIDMATYGELIGSTKEAEAIADFVGADSVNYQSLDEFIRSTGLRGEELCLGCVNGRYPTSIAQKLAREMRKRFENGYVETGRIYENVGLLNEYV